MPEGYRYPPPVTVVTTSPQGVVTKLTNVGTPSQLHAAPTAMSDPAQAARIMQQTQKQLATTTALVTSDPHTGRVIIKDQTMPGFGSQISIKHGLGRKYIGWAWNRPRSSAPALIEIAPTTALPADTFLTIQSASVCIVDLEIW